MRHCSPSTVPIWQGCVPLGCQIVSHLQPKNIFIYRIKWNLKLKGRKKSMIIFGQNFVFLSNVLQAKKRPFLPVSPRNPTSYKKSTFFLLWVCCFLSSLFFFCLWSRLLSVFVVWFFYWNGFFYMIGSEVIRLHDTNKY